MSPMNKELKDYITVFKNSNSISNEFLKHRVYWKNWVSWRSDNWIQKAKLKSWKKQMQF